MGGYVNVLSVYGNPTPEVPMNDVVFRYLHLKGINGRKMWSTWDTMHALLEQGAIDVERVLTHRMSIDDFPEAVELAIAGDCGKVVLDF
jgi:threonine 3-dehydrogenase